MNTITIQTKGLSKSFGSVHAVSNLDLEVQRGQLYAFLGRNGGGKTTTVRMLLGLIRARSGTIEIFGQSPAKKREVILSRIGFLVETAAAYPNLTVRENLDIQRRLKKADRTELDRVISLLKLNEYADRSTGHLSLGNKQRLSLARALINKPELLILDEPANGLDPAGIIEIRKLLRSLVENEGVTVFMSSHILDEVDHLADRIGIIHQGKLLEEVDYKAFKERGVDLESHFMQLTGGER